MGTIRLGLIGAGRIGKVHAEALALRIPEARVQAVADVNLAEAEALARRFAIPHACTDHRRIIDDPAIDAVVICSPTDTHARYICEAAGRRKHIFCEKPVDLTLTAIREALARRFSIPHAWNDHRRIIEDPAIDAVIICSPTGTHARYICESAGSGKHIFCEKPVDLTLKAIEEALAAVARAGVKLMVGFTRRFDPSFAKARQMIAEGKIGEPHLLRITSRDPQPPPPSYVRGSGGLFLDMAIHDFDMARFLLGREVTEVSAHGAVLVDPAIGEAGDVDTAVTVLRFEGGALGTIDNSRRAVYGYDQRVEVFGANGMVQADNLKHDTHAYFNSDGGHGALPLDFFMDRYAEAYYRELKAFVDALVHDTRPPVDGRDGLLSVALGLAAGLSLREHRTVPVSEVLGG